MELQEAYMRVRRRVEDFLAGSGGDDALAEQATAELETVCTHIEAALAGAEGAPLDLDHVQTAGYMHWIRHYVLPEASERRQDEVEQALALLHYVYGVDREAVPPETRPFFARRGLIAAMREWLVTEPGLGIDRRLKALTELSTLLGEEYQHMKLTATLKETADTLREIVSLQPSCVPLAALGSTLTLQFERTGELALLDDAVATLEQAVEAATTEAQQGMATTALANARGVRASVTRRMEVRSLTDLQSEGGSAGTAVAGWLLRVKYEQEGEPELLASAITTLRQAVQQQPEEPWPLSELGIALRLRFERYGNESDAEEATALGESAVARSVSATDRQDCSGALGATLAIRYRLGGSPDLLEAAVVALRRAVSERTDRPSPGPSILTNLGVALMTKADNERSIPLLDEAIGFLRDARAATPSSDPYLPIVLGVLGDALHTRAVLGSGSAMYLREAIELQREAVANPNSQAVWPQQAANLARTLVTWHNHFYDLPALDEAVQLLQAAREFPQAAPAISRKLSYHLAITLAIRWPHSGIAADIDEAVSLLQRHISETEPSSSELNALGGALRYRYDAAGDPADLDQAIACLERAVAGARTDDSTAFYNVGLGQALRARYLLRGETADLVEALHLLSGSARSDAMDVEVRTMAGNGWAAMADEAGEPQEALAAYRTLLDLLVQRVPAQLRRSDQQFLVGGFAGLASKAAACALDAGDVATALIFLEQGRGIVLADALNRRFDLTSLRSYAPELADDLESVTNDLDEYAGRAPDTFGISGGTLRTWTVERTHRLITRRAELIDQIRARTPLTRFLMPPIPEELAERAEGRSIVLVNVDDRRSDAILVSGNSTDVVPLPALRPEAVEEQAVRFLEALAQAGDQDADPDAQADAEETVIAVLGWLWESLVRPVLDLLDCHGPVHDVWPRIWWSPTGLLNFLPLHAAGNSEESALDRAISSYTPTIGMLGERRAPSAMPGRPRMLIVATPDTDGRGPLRGAEREAGVLAELFSPVRLLVNEQATADEVLAQIARHSWVHFACHAVCVVDEPLESHLLVHRGRVTVDGISSLHNSAGELAFLAVCESVRSNARLADEAVHLGAAFRLAGFRHVVGTLWSAADDVAARVVQDVYTDLAQADATSDDVPVALHSAVRSARARSPRTPSLWAVYTHFGP
ncbi:CHAT domain-containing protein [Nonomuraea sp. NPDC003709]|uniref:CHAT domain-containing protein n=1 Tax=Nonomuraea sp. NPDC003709 TaxID=3154450 RepID=UPI00339EEF98